MKHETGPAIPAASHHPLDRGHRRRRRAGAELLPLVIRPKDRDDQADTPFPKHWLYYIVLKYAVIAAAVLIALYVASQLL